MPAGPREFFVDTGAWFAFAIESDRNHDRVRETMSPLEGRLTTSNFVVDETLTLLRFRASLAQAVRAGQILRDPAVCRIERIMPEDEDAAWTLFSRRVDKRYSFTDCTSFALMRRLGIREAIALDANFRQEGFEARPA